MMRICAWCKIILQDGTLPASHGICDACADETFTKPDEALLRTISLARATANRGLRQW